MKIRNKLMLSFAVVAIVPMSIVGYQSYKTGKQGIEEDVINALMATAESRKHSLQLLLELRTQQTKMLASKGSLKELMNESYRARHEKGVNKEELAEKKERFYSYDLKEYKGIATYYDFVFVGRDGIVDLASDSSMIGKDLSNDPRFIRGSKEAFHTNIFRDINTGEPAISTVVPVVAFNKKHTLGVAISTMGTKVITRIMTARTGLGETGETYLVDNNNVMITESRFDPKALLNQQIEAEAVNVASKGFSGIYTDYRGHKVIGASLVIPEVDWLLVAEKDADEAFSYIDALFRRVLIFSLIAMGIAIILGYVLARSITSPIISLKKSFADLSVGRHVPEMTVESGGEIRELELAFNNMVSTNNKVIEAAREISIGHYDVELNRRSEDDQIMIALRNMATSLKDLNTGLEQKVEERTKEIEKINLELQQQIETINDAAIVSFTDAEGNITFVNDKFLEISGYSAQELIGKNHRILKSDKQSNGIFVGMWKAISTGHTWSGEICNKRKDGSYYWVQTMIKPFRNVHGEIDRYVSVRYDITKVKEQEERLKASARALEEKNRNISSVNKELEAFSYSVSHDLRAPLRTLQGFSRNLVDRYNDKLDDRGIRWLTYIKDNAEKMDQLINDILVFSRIGRSEIARTNLDVNELVRSTYEQIKPAYNGNISFKIDNELPEINGDRSLLQIVWQNLIDNALKYSSLKDKAEIHVSSWEDTNNYFFAIEDNGAGFNMEYHDKLFGVFQRLHANDEFEGTGVGLANVKKGIEKHGGKITAQGEENKGARFTFNIPKIK